MLDERAIIDQVLAQYKLPIDGDHGVAHWARVYENGLALARHFDLTSEQIEVVKLFAMLHDACRLKEHNDPRHGYRAGNILLRNIEETTDLLSDMTVEQLGACSVAMEYHTDANFKLHPNTAAVHPEIRVCWDADRLDLDRVGIKPEKKFLVCKDDAIIRECRRRGVSQAIPKLVLSEWGFELTPVARYKI
jgi:uncharacterized protein